MSETTIDEARRIVREQLSQDWTRDIGTDAYVIAPGGWKWRGSYVFADGPSEDEDPENFLLGVGLAAVDIWTGKARRLASSETPLVLTEGEELPGTPKVEDPED